MSDESQVISAVSMYGAQNRKGLVGIVVGDRKPVLISPEEARSVAADILQASTAAETDEVLMRWLMTVMELPLEQAAQVLIDLRKMRTERRAEQPPVEHRR